MKRHIKGFNIIRLVLACVIGIGAMNIGLISADDTRLVDEEAVKIEEVMSIGDDVSVISGGSLTPSYSVDALYVNTYTSTTTGRGRYTNSSFYTDIYYNGRFWGYVQTNDNSTTTTSVVGWTNTSIANPTITGSSKGDYVSSFVFNSNNTITLTVTGQSSSGLCNYSWIALSGPDNFGDLDSSISPSYSADALYVNTYTSTTTGRGRYTNSSFYTDIYYNGRFWGYVQTNDNSTTTTSVVSWTNTSIANPTITGSSKGDYVSSFVFNSNSTITLTVTGQSSSGLCNYSWIALSGPDNFGALTDDYGNGFGGEGFGSVTTYEIKKGSASNGSFVVASSAYADTTVTVGTTPNTGYKLNSVSVPGATNIVISGNNASFTMPGAVFLFFYSIYILCKKRDFLFLYVAIN